MRKTHSIPQKNIIFALLGIMLMLFLVACGGSSTTNEQPQHSGTGDPERGQELFDTTCFACHGTGGKGIEGLGKDMTTSEFIRTQSEKELLLFLKTGRSAADPTNTTGVDMPAKGGNNTLNDDDLKDIIAYIRTLQQ